MQQHSTAIETDRQTNDTIELGEQALELVAGGQGVTLDPNGRK